MESVNTDIFSNMFSFQDYLLNANIPVFGVTFLGNAVNKIYEIISFSGVQILIFLSAIQSVPKHLYEAAKIEGATQYEMFWKITFPMVSPMMLTAAVYTVVDSFLTSPLVKFINVYNKPGSESSELLGKLSYYGINAAMSWIFCLISVVIISLTLLILSKAVFYYDD
jgi:ABC-type sugar transport system permease subunit